VSSADFSERGVAGVASITRSVTMLDITLAIIILGTVTIALTVNIGAAAAWIRNRFRP
jgi:hypothetical protein